MRPLAVLLSLALAGPAAAQSLIEQAERLAQRKTFQRIGVAEMKRAAGQPQPALADLRRAEPLDDPTQPDGLVHPVQDLICWRLLAAGPGQIAELRAAVADLRKLPDRKAWLPVYELHLAVAAQDRTELVRLAAKSPPLPDVFPPIVGEQPHLALLIELGWPQTKAGRTK